MATPIGIKPRYGIASIFQKEALLDATAIFNLSAFSLDKYHIEGEEKRP